MKQRYPATQRNREPILMVLQHDVLPATGLVLEIASGSGEHAVYFAARLPHLTWQPSDPDPALRASIAAWRDDPEDGATPPNLRAPLALDVTNSPWPIDHADAIFCANMIHIAPWDATLGLFAGAARVLGAGPLALYGPFKRDGQHTAPSNESFDASLRARDERWGVRDIDAVAAVAATHGFALRARHSMPANNLLVVFDRAKDH